MVSCGWMFVGLTSFQREHLEGPTLRVARNLPIPRKKSATWHRFNT